MKLNVKFEWFWPGFRPEGSIFDAALRRHFSPKYVTSARRADLVMVSDYHTLTWRAIQRITPFGRPLRNGAARIFYSGEARGIDFAGFDAVISTNTIVHAKHHRLPQWVHYVKLWHPYENVTGAREAGFAREMLHYALPRGPRRFACAILGRPHHLREVAIERLRQFGEVDIMGRLTGRPVTDKMELLKNYRFNLCFENTLLPGYVTEKALHAKFAGCVPLWWGDPSFRIDFAASSLVNMYDFDLDFERMFAEVDLSRVEATPLMPGPAPDYVGQLADFLHRVLNVRA